MSESATNQTGSAISNPDPQGTINKSELMGLTRFDISDKDFCNCVQGRKKYSRWIKTISDENHRQSISKEFNKGKPILVRNIETKSMVYLRK
jgi:folate-dependent tRNA-U54 methylase TrmFO/GidA